MCKGNGFMDRLNVGVIGIGAMSSPHLERYKNHPRASLYAICDNDPQWLPDATEMIKPEKSFLNYNEMLADPKLDAVSICLPTALHAQATIAALNAGKHVLCEKPKALNAQEANEMKKAADASGKKLMISHNQRLEDNVKYIKKCYDEGLFGDIYMMRIGWRRPLGMMPPCLSKRPNGQIYNRNSFNEKDNGGGVLRDLGTHLLDLSMHIVGFPNPVDVVSSLYHMFYPDDYIPGKFTCDAEDLGTAQINFDSGMTMQLEVSFGSMVEEEVIFTELYGNKGGASRRNGKLKLISYQDGKTVVNPIIDYGIPTEFTQNCFVDAVLDDINVPITADEGVKIVEI